MPYYEKAGKRWPGVEVYESKSRRHNGRPDKCYYIRYRDNNSKMTREKVGWVSEGYSPQLAAQVRSERIRAVRHGEELPQKRKQHLTMNDIFQIYLTSKGATLKGAYKDRNRWQTHLQQNIGRKSVKNISSSDIENIVSRLRAEGKTEGTVWNVLELVRRIVNYGVDQKMCQPLDFKIKLPKRSNEKIEVLTPEQWKNLIKALDEYPDQAAANMVRLALFGGFRKSELFELKWTDIDFRNRIIHIRDAKSGSNETIPMSDLLFEVLSGHPKGDSEYIFPGKGGKKRVDSRIANNIKKIADLPSSFRPWHGLRHAFASALAETGEVDLYHLQKLLRHKTPTMVQRYAHLRNQVLVNSSNKLKKIVE